MFNTLISIPEELREYLQRHEKIPGRTAIVYNDNRAVIYASLTDPGTAIEFPKISGLKRVVHDPTHELETFELTAGKYLETIHFK